MNTVKRLKKDLKIKVIALMALIALWIFLLIRTPSFEELLASFIMFGVLLIIFVVGIYSDLKALRRYIKPIKEQVEKIYDIKGEIKHIVEKSLEKYGAIDFSYDLKLLGNFKICLDIGIVLDAKKNKSFWDRLKKNKYTIGNTLNEKGIIELENHDELYLNFIIKLTNEANYLIDNDDISEVFIKIYDCLTNDLLEEH